MSIFDALDRLVSRTVDQVNATSYTLTPMKATPNGRREPDGNRPVVTGRGILDLDGDDLPLELGNRDRRGNDLRSLVSGQTPVLSVDRSVFANAAQEPRQGDRIEFPGRSDLPAFEVASVQRDGLSRLVVRLVKAG